AFISRNRPFSCRSRMNPSAPYYQPSGPYPPDRPRPVHWLPIVIAAIFVAIGLFGLSSPTYSSRYGVFGGFFGLFFVLIIGFFIVRVVFWSTRTNRYGGRNRYGSPGGYGPNRPLMVARM